MYYILGFEPQIKHVVVKLLRILDLSVVSMGATISYNADYWLVMISSWMSENVTMT